MTRQHKPSEILKSITGGPLVGLGLHILLGNADRAATQLSQRARVTALCCPGGLASCARLCL